MPRRTLTSLVVAAGCVLPGTGLAQTTARDGVTLPLGATSDPAFTTWTRVVDGDPIVVSGTTAPRTAEADSPSAMDRKAAEFRADLRARLGWTHLSEGMKDALWEIAVGDDQIDPRGITLVTRVWDDTKSIRGQDHVARDLVLNFDGDVVSVGSNLGDGNNDPNFSQIFIQEIDATDNSSTPTENWEREPFFGGSGDERFVSGDQGAIDLYGNTYVCGDVADGRFTVWKFDGSDGSTLWSKRTTISDGDTADAFDIAVDPEGIVYVTGRYDPDGAVTKDWFVSRRNPDNGNAIWTVTLGFDGVPTGGIEVDRRGGIYVAGSVDGDHTCLKLSPADGSVVWQSTVATATFDQTPGFKGTLKLDFEGNPHYAGPIDSDGDEGWRITKWDREDGSQEWSRTVSGGEPRDLEIDRDGFVYVAGDSDSGTFTLTKRRPSTGIQEWRYSTGSTGWVTDVTIDRIGNPYICGWFGSGSQSFQAEKIKPDGVDAGTSFWTVTRSPNANGENNDTLRTSDIIVDAGGNVYVSGWRRATDGGNTGQEFFVVKYQQPYLATPLITRSYPRVSAENLSLYDPDNSLGGLIPSFSYSKEIFSLKVSDVTSVSNIEDALDKRIEYSTVFTNEVAKAGVKFGGLGNAEAIVSIAAELSAGDFSVSATGELAIAVPSEDDPDFDAGENFTITLNWDPDEMGTELISDARPQFGGGIKGELKGNIDVDFEASDTLTGLDVDTGLRDASINIGPRDIIGVGFTDLPEDGVWYDPIGFPFDQYVNAQIRAPVLTSEGEFRSNQTRLTSGLREKVFDGKIRVTNLLNTYFGGPVPLAFNSSPSGGSNSWDANLDFGILQADVDGRIFILQDLELILKPYVTLDFEVSGGQAAVPSQRVEFFESDAGGASGQFDPVEQREITVRMPDDGELTIRPTFGMDAVFRNDSGVEFELEYGFDAVRAELGAKIAGVKVLDIDVCKGCTSRTENFPFYLGDMDPPVVVDESFTLPNETELAEIQVFANTELQPKLIGASREIGRVLLYNQSSPSQSEFDAFASGTFPMILYGYDLGPSSGLRVRIAHHGRNEILSRTRLNDQALLVEVPNRFLLLPGTARLWVRTSNGKSESIDFPIEYPVPNFEGINRSYWAADPRWKTNTVTIKDGGTPAGNDSFIARRDYFTYLADTLWSSAILQDLGDPDQEAWEYFPAFDGWERPGDPASPPAFPALLVDGKAVPREPLTNDGKIRIKMPEGLVDAPGSFDMQICNPGPGGGPSQVVAYELPAPRPVVTEVEPAQFRPGAIEADSLGNVRLTVRGPEQVPYFDGFESEKFGNFTADTMVWVNKVPYPTDFIDSSELVATVPASVFENGGRKRVLVTTPANGTSYEETLVDGSGSTVFTGVAVSGGASQPVIVESLWPRPVVDYVSHTELELGSPPPAADMINGAAPPDPSNIVLQGDNFAPGCVVFFNGSALPTFREGPGVVKARLRASDLDALGTQLIWVGNPPPTVRTSDPVTLMVVAPAP